MLDVRRLEKEADPNWRQRDVGGGDDGGGGGDDGGVCEVGGPSVCDFLMG